MRDDETLFGWIRYYAGLIFLCVVLGAVIGSQYVARALDSHEASILVIESGGRVSARHVGPVAKAVFESAEVYEPAMAELGIDEDPRDFLESSATLLPVPETNVAIVLGSAQTQQRASEIAGAMAESLVLALNSQNELAEFSTIGEPQPSQVRQGVSEKVAGALGMAVGVWIAFAIAIIHYRWKRPVLTFRKALEMSEAERATVIDGKGWSWLGFLRRGLRWRRTPGNQIRLARLLEDDPPARLRVQVVGAPSAKEGKLAASLIEQARGGRARAEVSRDGHDGFSVMVVHAGTGERDLNLARYAARGLGEGSDGRVRLIWVR